MVREHVLRSYSLVCCLTSDTYLPCSNGCLPLSNCMFKRSPHNVRCQFHVVVAACVYQIGVQSDSYCPESGLAGMSIRTAFLHRVSTTQSILHSFQLHLRSTHILLINHSGCISKSSELLLWALLLLVLNHYQVRIFSIQIYSKPENSGCNIKHTAHLVPHIRQSN